MEEDGLMFLVNLKDAIGLYLEDVAEEDLLFQEDSGSKKELTPV